MFSLLLVICAAPAFSQSQTRQPVLISEPTSTRAIALESVTFLREPFAVTSPVAWNPDHQTRVMLFALNLSLQPGENLSAVTADAEDAAHRRYNLQVENIGTVPGQDWISTVILRLSEEMNDPGDVLVRITYRGVSSNRVRLGIGHIGGGPPDDNGSAPTPTPPYSISGRVISGGIGLSNVSVTLSGSQITQTVTTDNSGSYSFTVNTADNYVLTVTKPYYDFAPPSRTFNTLSNHHLNVDFNATRQVFTISGQALSGTNGLAGVSVALIGPQSATTITDANGHYSFPGVEAGWDYVITPSKNNYDFSPSTLSINNLSGDRTATFAGRLLTCTISGQVYDDRGQALDGIEVTLLNSSGVALKRATSSAGGNVAFPDIPTGYNYTIVATSTNLFTFNPQSTGELNNDLRLELRGVRQLYTIRGKISDTIGRAVAGVTINLSGSQTATTTTDSSGNYSFAGLAAGGNYTLTPAQTPIYNFTTQSINNLVSDQTLNFTGAFREYTISGRALIGTSGLAGVSITLGGAQSATTITDASGGYSFPGVKAGSDYVITPSKSNYDFNPSTLNINSLSGDQTVTFAGRLLTYTINGQVFDDQGRTMDEMEVTLFNSAGGVYRTTTTSAGGNFSFSDVPGDDSYSIAPRNTNFFLFSIQNINTLSGNLNLNFTGVRTAYEIAGRMFDPEHQVISGITVQLSGSQTGTAVTDSNGNYSFAGLASAGNYTISVSDAQYLFNPQSQTFNNLGGNRQANFNGTLRKFTIGGRVSDGINGIAGVHVTLSGSQSVATLTDANGNYSFSEVTAKGNYVIAVSKNNYTFNPSTLSISNLSGDQTISFTGTFNHYTLGGRIADAQDRGISNVALTLSGSQTGSAQTDVNGNYSFTVLAEGNYTITPSKPYYTFNLQDQTFNNLGSNQKVDFTGALVNYLISGRVTDSGGNGIVGIKIDLSGSQASTVRTSSDGSFSFLAPATGDYTITPSIEQDFYLFTPANRSFNNLIADQTAQFSATATPIPDPFYVLEYDGTQKTVDYGPFWTPYVDLGHFYWEFWAMPGENAGGTYLLSDGYGGAHALLFGFGFNKSDPEHYLLAGNTFDGYVAGQHVIFFGGDDGPQPGEWGHFAVGWDGENIITYYDGVPVGKKAFTGPRATPGYGGGGERLLIGGSDHNNFVGRIAQVRGYEGRNPLADTNAPSGGEVEAAFAPQTVFGLGGNLLSYFFQPAPKVADLSRGFDGLLHEGNTHVGVLRGTTNGILYDCDNCPPPRFVIDPTAPNFAQGTAPPPAPVDPPPPAPGGARVFDSFSRANSTYLFNGKGGLGSTEGGTLGAKVWQTGLDPSIQQPFGILNGRAVLLANERSLAWVTDAAEGGNLDVRVNRHPGSWGSGLDTGLSFRVVDDENFFFAYTSESHNSAPLRSLTLGYYLNGQRSDLVTGINLPTFWTTLRVVSANNGGLTVYADGTLVYTTTSNVLLNGTGAGLYNDSPGLGLVNRWDNFTVY